MSSCNISPSQIPDLNNPSDDLASRTMDLVLKARKMSSASARRKKIQERQQQQELDREKFAEHKRRIMLYDYRADRLSTHIDDLVYNAADDADSDAEQSDRESSAGTQSERSALTPDDTLHSKPRFGQSSTMVHAITGLKIQIPDEDEVLEQLHFNEDGLILPPSPKPVLQASLATLSDFRYDRYSMLLDSPLSETLSPEEESDFTFSPIETATPISYQQPKSRPSLISIVSITHQSKRRTTSLQSPLSQTVPQAAERPSKRQSTSSTRSGFLAAEATPFEVPSLPNNAFEIIANASQESLPISVKERPKSRSERKSSMPRLSTALSQARMSGIKSLIKTPTSLTPTPANRMSISQPQSHSSRPSTANVAADVTSIVKQPTAAASTNNIQSITRPTTAHIASTIMTGPNNTMTALPCLPTPPADDEATDPMVGRPAMSRKKSFSALRRRSESIGQAFKGLSKTTTKHDVPMPPTPKKSQTFDLSSFPTPPLPSPQTLKSSASSIASSRTRSSSGFFGLGLRSVDGLSQR